MNMKGIFSLMGVVAVWMLFAQSPTVVGVWLSQIAHSVFPVLVPVTILTIAFYTAIALSARWESSSVDSAPIGTLVVNWRDPLTYLGMVAWFIVGAGLMAGIAYWGTWGDTVAHERAKVYTTSLYPSAENSIYVDVNHDQVAELVWANQASGKIINAQYVDGSTTVIIDGVQVLWETRGVVTVQPDGSSTMCLFDNGVGALHGVLGNSMTDKIRAQAGAVMIDPDDAYGTCEDGEAMLYVPFTKTQGWWWPVETPAGIAVVHSDGSIEVDVTVEPGEYPGPMFATTVARLSIPIEGVTFNEFVEGGHTTAIFQNKSLTDFFLASF